MKLFTSIQKSFDRIGIYRNGDIENPSLNLKNYIFFAILAVNVFFTIMYLLIGSNKFSELCESFYYGTTAITNFVVLMQLIRKSSKIFKLIVNIENTIEKRK